MTQIPALCGSCGLRFSVDNFLDLPGPSAAAVRFHNSTTNCPRCGHDARFVEGSFDVVEGVIQMKSGPPWSWDLVNELHAALQRIVQQRPADPLAELVKTNREVAAQVEQVVEALARQSPRTSRKTLFYKVVVFLLATVFTAGVSTVVDEAFDDDPAARPIPYEESPETKQEQLHRIREHVVRTGKLPKGQPQSPPSPPPR